MPCIVGFSFAVSLTGTCISCIGVEGVAVVSDLGTIGVSLHIKFAWEVSRAGWLAASGKVRRPICGARSRRTGGCSRSVRREVIQGPSFLVGECRDAFTVNRLWCGLNCCSCDRCYITSGNMPCIVGFSLAVSLTGTCISCISIEGMTVVSDLGAIGVGLYTKCASEFARTGWLAARGKVGRPICSAWSRGAGGCGRGIIGKIIQGPSFIVEERRDVLTVNRL